MLYSSIFASFVSIIIKIRKFDRSYVGDACTPNPCLNGASCTSDGNGGFNCQCVPGFVGLRCEDSTYHHKMFIHVDFFNYLLAPIDDPCASNPCFNYGTCMRENGGFRCVCPVGYTGNRCEARDACQSNPCANGGTCQPINGNGGYQCLCPIGFSGMQCENRRIP